MQSPRKGVFSRVSQGLGFSRPSKRLQRDSVPSLDSSGVRRPPVGGGSHVDDEDQYPAAQRDQPARVQEGTEGFKAASSQPAADVPSQPAASEFSEIQPASSSEDVSGQTVFAAPYKNNAISKLMAETTGPSTTIPPSTSSQLTQSAQQQSQHPQATTAAPEPEVTESEPNTERVQTVPGFDSKASAQGQNMNTGGFRSSSGVPSEDELAQLYSNDAQGSQGVAGAAAGQRRQAVTEGMDMPEDTQIGFSGKGSGIFGSFATPARSARPPAQTAQVQEPSPSVLQLPESEELRSYHQPEGVAAKEAAPFTDATQPSAGQRVTPMPEGGTPTYSEAQPQSMSEAVHGPESAASGRFMTPPESPESLSQDPPVDTGVPFHTDTAQQQYVTPTAQHGVPESKQVAPPTKADSHHVTQPVGGSGSYGAGPESAQVVQEQSQVLPSGVGQPSQLEGQQDKRPADFGSGSREQQGFMPFSHHKDGQSGGQGIQALAEGSQQYPATPDRFSRAPHPASPEDFQDAGIANQGFGSATQGASQYTPPLSAQPLLEEEAPLSGNKGVSDIPNYPRENPLFDEEQAQQEVSQEAEAEPAAKPVFHDNPAFDEKAANTSSLGSPMIPNRGSFQRQGQQGSYESSPQVESHSGFEEPVQYSDRRTPSIDIPPEFDPNNPQQYTPSQTEGGFESARQVTNQGLQPSETLASGPPATVPQSVTTAAQHEPSFEQERGQPELHRQLSEPHGIPHEETQTVGHVTTEPQLYDNGAFEQQETRHSQPYGESDIHSQREHPSEAVTAVNAAVEEEVMIRSEPQAETESNAADDGQVRGQQSFEQHQGGGATGLTAPTQEPAIAQAFDVKEPSFSEETVVEEPAPAEEAARERLATQEGVVPLSPRLGQSQEPAFGSHIQPEAEVPPPRSMLVQEGDPPVGRPVIQSKEATLTAQPPSASWGSAAGFAPYVQTSSVPFGGVQAEGPVTSGFEAPRQVEQSTVTTEAPATDIVMVDQDPPIDPSVETAPPAEPTLPVSTMTGTSTGVVTSTPQLGPASPGVTQATTPIVTQEVSPAATQPAAMSREDVTAYRPAQDPQVDPSEGQPPVVAPRPPPMTTQEIAAYRSGADPDFDPVERRGWWEVDLTAGGGTILPSNTRGPRAGTSRGTGRGQARTPAPAMTGPHIHAGGDPSQATHFGSIVPGGTRRQQGAAARSGGARGMEHIGGAPGVYDTPPLAGQAQPTQGADYESGGLTPAPTPVAPLGQGETHQTPIPVKPMSTQEVAAYRPAQDPKYDPTEGRSSGAALPSALPSAGNDQIDNPLFEEQQHEDISGTEFDQGNDTSPTPFASGRQQEFYSSMYGSSMERQPSSSVSESSLSTLEPTQQQASEYEMSAEPAFSRQPVPGSHQPQTTAPSVAAASLAAFYQGPFFPRKSSLTKSQQLADEVSAQPASVSGAPSAAATLFSDTPPLGTLPHQLQHQAVAVDMPQTAEADLAPAKIQLQTPAQQERQQRPINIPPPFSDSEGSASAHTPFAEAPEPIPSVLLSSNRSTVFGDGPTFAGSPIFSPSDVEDAPFTSEGAHRGMPFSSELERDPSYALASASAVATAPVFQHNPIFSEADEQPQLISAPSPLPQAAAVSITEGSLVDQSPTFQNSPILGSSDIQQQQQVVAEHIFPSELPPTAAEAAPVTQIPHFADRPILNSSADPLASHTLTSEPAVAFQGPLPSVESPTFHSNPIFSEEPTLAEQPQAFSAAAAPSLLRETSITLTEPETAQEPIALTSAPILSTQPQLRQQQGYMPSPMDTSLQSEPSFALPEQITPPFDVAFSDQSILGRPLQQQQQQQQQTFAPAQTVTPMQSEPSLAFPEQLTPTAAADLAFSDQPICGRPVQQQQQAFAPAQIDAPTQSQPSFALPAQITPAQADVAFSNQPIFGEPRQQRQVSTQAVMPTELSASAEQGPALSNEPIFGTLRQQQQFGYTLSQVPAYIEAEAPAVYGSPRFQSRPIFGTQQAQQAQQAHIQTVSADNPWAYRETALPAREPSPALPPVEVPSQGVTYHDNSLFESADQPQLQSQLPSQRISYYSSSPLAASSQQPSVIAQQPASPFTPVNQGITYFNESPFASPHIGHQHQQSFLPESVPVSVSRVPAPYSPAPSFTSEPTLGPPAQPPMDTAHPASAQRAQRSVHFSPASTFTAPATPLTQISGVAIYDTPPLGFSPSQAVTSSSAEPIGISEPLSDPLYDPALRAVSIPGAGAIACVPALLQPLDDPLYDPVQRRPVVAPTTHPVRPSILLQPLDDPLYDPTVQRPLRAASSAAAPHGPRFVAAQNSRFPKQQNDPLYDPAAVETLPGQKDVTHRGEQVGTPTFAPQGGAPVQQPPQGRPQTVSTGDFSTRPILGGSRRPARTVNLTDIGRPAPAPVPPEPYVPPQSKAEHELGAADVLPQDTHYVKPTIYAELGTNARSALSGAGWKSTWAMEMEASQQALKYPVGPVQPKGASGYAPRAAPETAGEPDYAALARGEPGFRTGGQVGGDMPLHGVSSGSSATAGLPPSATGATSDLGGGVGPQPGYMQLAPPPVHPGAPVTDRGFTGPGGAAGGARRRLAGKLFERQHSLQDPPIDPVSQRFGRDEGYGVELPEHKPANLPTGRTSGRASTGVASEQGVGVGGPSRGVSRASSVAGGYPPMAPQYEQEEEEQEEVIPEEGIQEEVTKPVDKTKEMNERLLVEVRRRLQAARSQLHTGPPSEADGGTPVDSPLGGRPKVLQGQGSSGTPGQYWRTLEEVEAEGSNPMSRNAPSPWVQTRGPELVPRRLSYSGGASSGLAPPMRSGIVPSGRVHNKGLEGYNAGRVHNIAGGYPTRRSRGGNMYSWGREGVF